MDWKNDLQTGGEKRKSQKRPTLVVGKKPNGKSQFKMVNTHKEILRVCFTAYQLVLLAFTVLVSVVTVRGQVLLSTGFETNALGAFPAGWQLIYTGAGSWQQFVDGSQAASGARSLHLVGSSCWCAEAYYPITLPDKVRYQVSVRVSGDLTGGCTQERAVVCLFNPTNNDWGTYYGDVTFSPDGFIYAVGDRYNFAGTKVSLQAYETNVWYNVVCTLDLSSCKMDVEIDGVRRATGMSFTTNGLPTGFMAEAGHGVSPTAWFDDVLVVRDNTIGGAQYTIGGFSFTFYGTVGSNYILQASSNLVDWTSLLDFSCTNNVMNFQDTSATGYVYRFYQIKPQ
jgi:hypothetical protein